MKKIVIGIVCFFCVQQFIILSGENNEFKVRAAAFIHSSKLFRRIYKPVGPCVELEYAHCLSEHTDVWANGDYFYSRGRSIGLKSRTRINIANFSFGIKYCNQFHECHSVYIGVGPSFGKTWLKNDVFCGCSKISKHAIGAVFKAGVNCDFRRRGFVDFFADYLYQPVHFPQKVDIGGLKVGLGLGVRF